MSQTIRQHQQLRVQIGSNYHGPAFDRPCLRAMPRDWQLEEAKPESHLGDKWVAIVCGLVWLFAIVQTALQFY